MRHDDDGRNEDQGNEAQGNEALRGELLEYAFGVHPEPERIERRLTEPRVRALMDQVEREAALLSEAAREEAPRLDLRPVPGARTGAPVASAPNFRRWAKVAAVLLALCAGVPGLLWALRAQQLARVEDGYLRLVVSGPPGMPDGASARFRVETWDSRSAARPCTVRWQVLDEEGEQLAADYADSDGSLDIEVSGRLAGARKLVVEAGAGDMRQESTLDLSPDADSPLVHLTTDKPVYQPGEPLWLRGVFLDRLTLEPREGAYQLRLRDPKGAPVQDLGLRAERGVVSFQWHVPDDAAGGNYAVEVRDANNEFTVEELPFLVRRYQAPRLAKRVDLDKKTYAPGERGAAEVRVERVEGGVAAGARVEGMLVVDGEEVWRGTAELDAEGEAILAFEVPGEVRRGEGRFVARVTDGGVVESAVEPFVIPLGRVDVEFFPEGGELVAGVVNRVYAECADPLERPVSARGRVVSDTGEVVASFETEHLGRARFDLTPDAGSRYRVEFDEPQAEPVELPEVLPAGVALRAVQDSTEARDPVRLEVHTPHQGPWIAGLFCRGVLVAQDTFAGSGRQTLELDPGDRVAGVLRATVFDAELRPVAERLVHRESARSLDVRVEPALAPAAPGAHQTLAFTATTETGAPAADCVLGVSVSDRAVRDMVGEDRVGLSDATWLFADAEQLEEFAAFTARDEEARRNLDLLLGTRGWRRFAWVDPKPFVEEHGAEARALLLREGRPQVPVVADSRVGTASEIHAARRGVRDARGFTLLGLTGGGVLLVLLLLARLVWFAVGRAAPSAPLLRPFAGFLLLAVALGGGYRLLIGGLDSAAPAVGLAAAGEEGWLADFDVEVAQGAALVEGLELGDGHFVEAGALRALGYGPGGGGGGGERFFLGAPARGGAGPGAGPPAMLNIPPAGVMGPATGGPGAPRGEIAEDLRALDIAREGLFAQDDEDADGLPARGAFSRRQPVRVYAHRRAPGEARTDFTRTVYWNPLLVTDAEGRATAEFDLADQNTTWDVAVDAHGKGRVGQALERFESRVPFRIESKLPVEATQGDRFDLPVAFVSEDAEVAAARLAAKVVGPLAFPEEAEAWTDDVALDQGRGRAYVPVEVGAAGQPARLLVTGAGGTWRDTVVHDLRVVPRGFPHRVTKSGLVSDTAEFEVALPEDHVPGSLTVELVLYPSRLADLLQGLDGILRMPGGCFEQASASNYPNVLALGYLQAAGADEPAIAARARGMLDRGYDLLTGYECSERGYEWFGGDPGHESLTAYGLIEFADMSAVYEVEDDMVDRTRDWLMKRRDGDGGFRRNAKALDSFGRAPQPIEDAYCTYALAITGVPERDLAAELDRQASRAVESDDAYEVALAAGALHAAGRAEAADAARDRLKTLQADDGSLCGSTTSITSSGERDLRVETTAFAALAWLDDEEDAAHAQRAVEFLLSQRTDGGRFGATQATVMALKALTAHASASRRIASDGTVRVLIDGREHQRLEFRAGRRERLAITGLDEALDSGVHTVRIELSGENEFPWSFDLAYTSDQPADDPACPLELVTRLGAETVREGETVALDVRVANRTDDGLPMTLAIVGLPAGLEAPTEVLDDLLDAEQFDLWELRGRDLCLYWRDLAPGEARRVSVDCLARVPGRTQGPASRAFLYYTPDQVRWAPGLTVTVEP